MLNTPHLKLSPEEDGFLRHWIYDEAHYQEGPGRAKQLQLRHGAIPADLATLVAAAMPDPKVQEAAGRAPPPVEAVMWPWTEQALRARGAEAKAILAKTRHPIREDVPANQPAES